MNVQAAIRPMDRNDGPPFYASAPEAALRITASGHFVYAGRVGGAEHMFYNLMHGLAGIGADLTVLCGDTANLDPAFVEAMRATGHSRVLARGGAGLRFVAEQRACLDTSLSGDAVLFPNYYVPPYVPRRLGRVISVLHDMQYRHFRANFSQKKRIWLRCAHNLAVRRADKMVVISEFVRDDALKHLGERFADKLAVVPNPISWERFGPADPARPMARPYVLSVAAQYAHKNLDVLVEAFSMMASRHPDTMLVLCGQDYGELRGVSGAQQTIASMAEAFGVGDRVRVTGYVDDSQLGNWYRHAAAFAFPSIFEGFGMPPVEALGFGLPAIVANRTALPSVTMGLALTVDAVTDPGAWAEALCAVLEDPERYAPNPDQAAVLRAYYAPKRIARAYADLCAGT